MVTQENAFVDDDLTGPVACIIVAGGSGTRFGGDHPKQFNLLGDRPVLAHAVRFFDAMAEIDRLIVVVPKALIEDVNAMMSDLSLRQKWEVVAGGVRRQDSVLEGLRHATGCAIAMVHDGARPFPPAGIVAAIERARGGPGVVFGMPSTDSIKRVDSMRVMMTVPRLDLWAMQTPQIFPTQKLIMALEQCETDGAEVTDDASAFEHMGWPVEVVMGSRTNLKITYPEDFILAEAILKGREKID